MDILKKIGKRLEKASKELDSLEDEVKQKENLTPDFIGPDTVFMKETDFIFQPSDSNIIDMKTQDPEEKKERNNIIALKQRIDEITKIVTKGKETKERPDV